MITLMKNLDAIHDPHFRCAILRRSFPQLTRAGGLIDESQKIYPDFGGIWKAQAKKWVFPSGAEIMFGQISSDSELTNWLGSQLTRIMIDEVCDDWEESQLLFLLSRLRSAHSKIKPQLICTGNPNRTSFMRTWVDFCLDPDQGTPVEGTEHKTRYFAVLSNKVLWADTAEECFEIHGKPLGMVFANKLSDKEIAAADSTKLFFAKSFRFIPMTIWDNPFLLPPRNNDYLANLLAQSKVNQQRYLFGSWTAQAEGSSHFRREWVKIVDYPPAKVVKRVRAWDLAASEASEANPNPDWTVGLLMSKDHIGNYYVEDMKRFRKLANGVLEEIVKTGFEDDRNFTEVSIPRDTGAGGAASYQFHARILSENGLIVRQSKMSGHSSKLNRFLPFAAVAEAGCVYVVKGDWNEAFFTELENFVPGNRNQKDDAVDSVSDAFNQIAKSVDIPTFVMPNTSQLSIAERMQ